MRWWGRVLWFGLGVTFTVLAAKAHQFWQDWANSPIDVTVINGLENNATVSIHGYLRTVNLGEVGGGREVSRRLTVSDLGEGPAELHVATARGETVYPLGLFLSDNGPFERYVSLAPDGSFAFFYAGTKGSWCGPLRPERSDPPAPAATLPPGASN